MISKGIERLKDLSKELNVEFHSQDWGIIAADPYRIEEFIEYYKNHRSIYPALKEHLAELIIASYNDALDEGLDTLSIEKNFVNFLVKYKNEFPWQYKYWVSLKESEEFQVVKVLKAVAAHQNNPDDEND